MRAGTRRMPIRSHESGDRLAMTLTNPRPHIAVLGGGLQGCCIALALAERRARVTLYDRNDALMTQAAVVNEGRMHLGYIYAADTSLATARMMIRGGLAFAPFIERYVGLSPGELAPSGPRGHGCTASSTASGSASPAPVRSRPSRSCWDRSVIWSPTVKEWRI